MIKTQQYILRWKHYAHQNQWDNNSIAAYMYRLRLFFKYWSKYEKLSLDVEDILIPKRQSKLPRYLSLEQCRDVYRACLDDRERAFVSLLFSTGIRVGEACRIRVKDIQKDKILIRGKAGKERYVYLDDSAYSDIQKHVSSRKVNSPYLFSGYSEVMNKSTIQKCIRDLGVRSGIPHLTPHVFRHTYATLLLGNGCNLRHIQEMLGHADISTTQIYTHVSNNDLAQSYETYHVSLS
jgi:site-specific recombinase XerD